MQKVKQCNNNKETYLISEDNELCTGSDKRMNLNGENEKWIIRQL